MMKSINKKKVTVVLLICTVGVLGFVFAIRVYATQNYSEPDGPRFVGSYADNDIARSTHSSLRDVTVVSYNIRYALNMDEAIVELEMLSAEQGIDILLLQEMDEIGVEQVAKELGLNYVYYPAGIEPLYSHHFGNAILSTWPITDTQKLVLPHKSFATGLGRVATKAIVTIQDTDIVVYSVHTETMLTLPSFRQDQFEAILADVEPDADYVIIGGDFNTVTQADVDDLTQVFVGDDYARVTVGLGNTYAKYQVEALADHIFSSGFNVVESGKMAEATASDHLPIWAQLKFLD